jgi:outer membrane protein assembly factor BamB
MIKPKSLKNINSYNCNMRNIIYAFKKILNNKAGKIGENWKFDVGSPLNSGPVVADIDGDGNFEIVTGTADGKLVALDKEGNLKWSYAINEKVDDLELMFLDNSTVNSIGNTPHAEDVLGNGETNLLFGTELGYVYLINFNGTFIWKFKAEGAIRGVVLCHDFGDNKKVIIFGSLDNYVYCISNKGELIWKVNVGSEVEGSPAVIDNKIIIGTVAGDIYCISKTSEILWKFHTDAKVSAQPAELEINNSKRILVGSTDGILYCLDLSGNILWKFKTGGAIYGKATIKDLNHNGKLEILFGSCDNFVYCLNQEGKKLWSFETDFWVISPPIVFDLDNDGKEEIIIGSYDHNIYILDSQGSYIMDYAPGISGTVNQAGSYSEVMTQSPGKLIGKKIWQFNVEGVIVGCTVLGPNIVLNTKKGQIKSLKHLKE